MAPSGAPVPGPVVSWKNRRHGPRKDRRWANAWSPEQIARRLPVDFPDDATMRISHEAIYQALFVQGRGALRRELTACLRTGRVLRMPRARTRGRGKAFISPEGTVKLTEPRARGDEFWSRWASGDGACVGDLAPDSKAAVTRSAAGCSRCRFWIRDVKEVRDLIVNRQEPLRLPG